MEPQVDFLQELQKLTLNGLSELGKWIEGAKDFALEQMPLFVQEYVRWFIVENAVWAIACLVFILIISIAAYKVQKVARAWDATLHNSDQGLGVFAACVVVIAAFIVSMVLTYHTFEFVANVGKGIWAPRVVIVDGIKNIIKQETKKPCQQ